MSQAPREVKETLLKSARAERQSEAAAKQGLEALLAGAVEPLDLEGPALEPEKRRLPYLVGGLVLVLLAAAWWSKLTRAEPVVPVPEAPTAPAMTTRALVPPPPPPSPVVVEVDAGDAAVDAGPPSSDAGRAPATPKRPTASDDDALARELAVLDEARLQLAKDPQAALGTLGRHRAQFPRGALRLEADLLRVEAQLKLGRKDEAKRLAKTLEKADREGLVRDRLGRLFELYQ